MTKHDSLTQKFMYLQTQVKHTYLHTDTQRPAKTPSFVCTCTHTQHTHPQPCWSPHRLTFPATNTHQGPRPPGPGSLPTCFGNLVHGHTQLLRHVAQHREDGEAGQDAGDGISQSDDESVSAGRSPGTSQVSFTPRGPPRLATLLQGPAPGSSRLH